jgi:hypothetical protein
VTSLARLNAGAGTIAMTKAGHALWNDRSTVDKETRPKGHFLHWKTIRFGEECKIQAIPGMHVSDLKLRIQLMAQEKPSLHGGYE